ncbi:MAG: large ribosomal subunit protein uL5 [Minisyncoccia bacterium]
MLREEFKKIKKELKKELKIENDLRVPVPKFAVVNIGIGKLVTAHYENKDKILEEAEYVLSMVTGQKPKVVKAKKSVAGFKLRKNMPVSVLVTLRGKKLLDFIERLVTYALPRARDFKGIRKNNIDDKGNLNLGLKEINIFPEAISDKIKNNFGIGITIVGTGKTKEENIKLWEKLGFPIKI